MYLREVIPVHHEGRVVALVSRDTGNMVGREASQLETAYIDAADDLFQMVVDGTFPPGQQTGEIHTGPRAGDGLIRLDADGRVVYVSPNAQSAYHRMNLTGSLIDTDLASVTRRLIADPFDGAELAARIRAALDGRASLRMEVEVRAATVLFRALPLRPRGRPSGALVLVRDVTEVRRRDRALLSKDATIREIHHRVKNNLQTVAALLRLQARRSKEGSVRHALNESVRRVAAIALVHDTLATSPEDRVDLDQIVDRLVPMIAEVASTEVRARVRRIGSFGVLGAELATPLVMVLAEVVQNALEHGYRVPHTGAEVVIGVERSARHLDIRVVDDGVGLPVGFSLERGSGLGLQIVRTLVDAELLGSIRLAASRRRTGDRGVDQGAAQGPDLTWRPRTPGSPDATTPEDSPGAVGDRGDRAVTGSAPGLGPDAVSGLAARPHSCRPRHPRPVRSPTPRPGIHWSPGSGCRPLSPRRSATTPGLSFRSERKAPDPRRDRLRDGANPWGWAPSPALAFRPLIWCVFTRQLACVVSRTERSDLRSDHARFQACRAQ